MKSFLPKLFVGCIALVVLLICVIVAFFVGVTTGASSSFLGLPFMMATPVEVNNTTGEVTHLYDREVGTIGQTITAGDAGVSLLVSQIDTSYTSTKANVKDGYKLVAVFIKITDQVTSATPYSLSDFSIIDSNDVSYTHLIYGGKEPEFTARTLGSNESNAGWVTFEVPNDSKSLKLSFDTTYKFAYQPLVVNLGI